MSLKTHEKIEKVSLPIVIVFSILLAFVSIVWISLLPSGLWHFYNLGIVACPPTTYFRTIHIDPIGSRC